MDGWMDGWMDEWIEGWMDEWMDGWMDGWMDICSISPSRSRRVARPHATRAHWSHRFIWAFHLGMAPDHIGLNELDGSLDYYISHPQGISK